MKRFLGTFAWAIFMFFHATAFSADLLSRTTQQYYPSGSLRLQGSVRENFMHVICYREDGTIEGVEISSDGLKNSVRTNFDRGGNTTSVDRFNDGETIDKETHAGRPVYDIDIISNPMTHKGQEIALRMHVLQVLDSGILFDFPWYPSDWDIAARYFYGYYSKDCKRNSDIFDGCIVDICGTIVGTYSYRTTVGSQRTVPKIKIKSITTTAIGS